jgi:hypothetical protein
MRDLTATASGLNMRVSIGSPGPRSLGETDLRKGMLNVVASNGFSFNAFLSFAMQMTGTYFDHADSSVSAPSSRWV